MDAARMAGVVFDLYGTLVDPQSVQEACGEVTRDGAGFASLWRAKQLEYALLRSLMEMYEDFWALTRAALDFTAERLGVELSETQRQELMGAWLRLQAFPDVGRGIGRLEGRSLAVLSNGSPRMLEAVLEHTGLRPRFGEVISVDAARIYKPSPRVYALGPERLGVSAERLLFVSANSWDVAGAKTFGYSVCWLNRIGAPMDRLGVGPDLVVREFDEIRAWLGDRSP